MPNQSAPGVNPAPVSVTDLPHRTEPLTKPQQLGLVNAGLGFTFLSLVLFACIILWLLRFPGLDAYKGQDGGPGWWYAAGYAPALILFASGMVCAAVGYGLLSAAGAATREVIPRSDYDLLSYLVRDEKEKGIDLYVRLNSLSGPTGFFTKIGITGLPLATIILTVLFTALALSFPSSAKLFDLANLTLGAFLGSYVQRIAPPVAERKARADASPPPPA